MIDTIVLTLTQDMFQISKPDKFPPSLKLWRTGTPSARWANNNAPIRYGMQSKQNPLKKEMRSGIYKPRLTLHARVNSHRTVDPVLKIELSLPKLMFGNNFDELRYKDFLPIVKKLHSILTTMGVITTTEILALAPVSAVHYSKNILLTDGSTPYHYIQKIKEANIKLSLDVNQTDYRNEGHCFKWHCNSYEVVFYDKIKDLEKAKQSGKRAIEKESELQLDLFKQFKKRKMLEVFRMEVRLNKRQKIKSLFKTLGIKTDLTFKQLFKPAISKKVLLHYLDELESKRPVLLDYKANNDRALLAALMFNNPEMSPKQILQMLGLAKILESVTIRELRAIFAHCNKQNWYRLMSDARKAKLPSHSPFLVIRKHLERYKPLRLLLSR